MPAAGPETGTFYLVDAHSLIFQVFHAIRDMSSPSGLPTNAVFGFLRDVLFIRRQKPTYLVCAFDHPDPTFRHKLDAAYKAHREPMPDDLSVQIPMIRQALAAMRVPVLEIPGYEADDVLATLAKAGEAKGLDVFLCTSDKDCRQLISDRVKLYNLRKRTLFGREELKEDWGIAPEQVVDLQAMVGDSVDNVPGIPGIGIKTAAKLLQDFGTLENVLANVDKVSGKKRQEELRNAGPKVAHSRPLVLLNLGVPIDMDWDSWKVQEMDVPRLVQMFQQWGVNSLRRDVLAQSGVPTPAAVAGATAEGDANSGAGSRERPVAQGDLFAGIPEDELFPFGANAPGSEDGFGGGGSGDWKGNYHLVDTQKALGDFLKKLQKQERFSFDSETTSLSPLDADIVGLSFAWEEGEAYYLPLRGPKGAKLLDPEATLEKLRPLLEDAATAKVNQNIKYDLLVLRASGVSVAGVRGDPMVADYLLHAGERTHNLEELSRRYLNHQVIPITDLIGKKTKKQAQLRMDEVPTAKVAEYAGEDADVAWRLAARLEPQLEKEGVEHGLPPLRPLYDAVEVPLIEVLAELEFNGIGLDVPLLEKLGQEMGKQLEAIEHEIYELAGHPFNIGSLVQLRKVLFDELKLPPQRKTGVTGAASTDQETLEKLAALDHPGAKLPRKIVEHRQIAKLKSTYVDALLPMVNAKTGRVHASFNQTVTSTGRISSSDPNLQNIPVRREQGQQIRQAFIPQKGWKLVTADYSQIELRLLAHFSGDETLRRAFAEDKDIHTIVASQIFNVPPEEVKPDQRRMAKTVNFGVLYGMSPPGLAQRLAIPRDEAVKFIDAYFARYAKVYEYQQRLLEQCRRTNYVTTILGRRRRIEGIRPESTYQSRNQPEREAINMEIQGSAADLIKLAMLHLYRRMKEGKYQARMLLQIHDELVFEAPPGEVEKLTKLVRHEMTTPLEKELKLHAPLRVDIASGPNWLDVS